MCALFDKWRYIVDSTGTPLLKPGKKLPDGSPGKTEIEHVHDVEKVHLKCIRDIGRELQSEHEPVIPVDVDGNLLAIIYNYLFHSFVSFFEVI